MSILKIKQRPPTSLKKISSWYRVGIQIIEISLDEFGWIASRICRYWESGVTLKLKISVMGYLTGYKKKCKFRDRDCSQHHRRTRREGQGGP